MINQLLTIISQSEVIQPSEPISFSQVAAFGSKDYLAFGSILKVSDTDYRWYGRNANGHTSGGVIGMIKYNSSSKVLTTQNVLTHPTYNLQSVTPLIISGTIYLYVVIYDGSTFQGLRYYKSTDGLTGEAFDSGTDLSSFLTYVRYNTYGLPFEVNGTYYITWYEHNDAGTWRQNYLTTTNGSSYTNHNMSDGEIELGEQSIIPLGGNNLLSLGRKNVADYGIYQSYSTDLGANWSTWTLTNLSAGLWVAMPYLNLNKKGLVDVVFGDRGTNLTKVSIDNPLTILTNPTAWTTPKTLYTHDTAVQYTPLGYPSIVDISIGRYLAFTASDVGYGGEAKLYYGDGNLNDL